MTMKLVKKTAEYSIFQRGDNRYAVQGAKKTAVNGEEKVRILVAEGLLKVAVPAKPEEPAEEAAAPEESAEAEAAGEEAQAAEEAPAAEADN